MARRPRLELAGVPQHVIQRGNNRADCFFADWNYRIYLRRLAEVSVKYRCAIHAYVLMTNHVHLLATPLVEGGISRMMQALGRSYVRMVNDAIGRTGTLWEGRFKSNMVETETYFLACHRYIELNPGIRDPLITEHDLYRRLGTSDDARQGAFRDLCNQALDNAQMAEIRSAANQGWALGSETFKVRLESKIGRPVRPPKRGRPVERPSGKDQGQENLTLTPFMANFTDN